MPRKPKSPKTSKRSKSAAAAPEAPLQRFWVLHPTNLPTEELQALWEAGVTARDALSHTTKAGRKLARGIGFDRFVDPAKPADRKALDAYLHGVAVVLESRKVVVPVREHLGPWHPVTLITTRGQLAHERRLAAHLQGVPTLGLLNLTHPMFRLVPGTAGE